MILIRNHIIFLYVKKLQFSNLMEYTIIFIFIYKKRKREIYLHPLKRNFLILHKKKNKETIYSAGCVNENEPDIFGYNRLKRINFVLLKERVFLYLLTKKKSRLNYISLEM